MVDSPGVLTISLDTELAWGCFDLDGVEIPEAVYRRTTEVVTRLCNLFEKYQISATWAIVTHLLKDCRSEPYHQSRVEPEFDWINRWFDALPCVDCAADIWHSPELIETIRNCAVNQEIGLHGDTHMILGAAGCSQAAANAEIEAAIRTAREAGMNPTSFVYPRNSIGHRSILQKHGLTAYRGRNAHWYERRDIPEFCRKGLRFLEEALVRTPPVVVPREFTGLVEIPGSQIFRPNHGGWQWTPEASQLRRAAKGMEQAASTGKIFHLWFHPFNLARDPEYLLDLFEQILSRAKALRDTGQLEVLTFRDIAMEYQSGRWNNV